MTQPPVMRHLSPTPDLATDTKTAPPPYAIAPLHTYRAPFGQFLPQFALYRRSQSCFNQQNYSLFYLLKIFVRRKNAAQNALHISLAKSRCNRAHHTTPQAFPMSYERDGMTRTHGA